MTVDRCRLDLQSTSALSIALLADGRIEFVGDLPPVDPSIRTSQALRDALLDPEAAAPAELYYMYRGLTLPHHRELFRTEGLSYDVTVLRPGTIGGEFVKTFGHYHPLAPGQDQAYPEVYEVLAGRGHFLLQKPVAPPDQPGETSPAVLDVILVEAGPGEKVLIPPGYGHVTINPGGEWLVIANLVAVEFSALYEPFRQARGAAYYEVAGEGFRPNPRYESSAPLRPLAPADYPALGIVKDVPFYRAFLAAPERFAFLRNPLACPAALSA